MTKKVLIIGGGVAGLSTGIYAQINGYATEIIEMHTLPGGQCTAWNRKGYRFDYCIHWLVGTAFGSFYDVWNETGALNKDVRIVNHAISSRFYNEAGEDITVYTDLQKWENYLYEIAPEDTASIKKMCATMKKGIIVEPFINAPECRTLKDYLHMMKMIPLGGMWMKYGKMNCADYFKILDFKNTKLRTFFNTFYAEQDFSAAAFLMMFAWNAQKNCGYPIGGSLLFTTRMATKYKSWGGRLTLGKKVSKIIVENDVAKGVILTDGTKHLADYVISAADGHATIYDMLEGKYSSKLLEHAYENWKLFSPFAQVAFGVNKIYETDSPSEFYISKGNKIGCTPLSPGYSIMNYAFDETMAPAGKSVLIIRFDSPWALWENMDEETYKKEKIKIEEDVRILLEKRYSGVSAHIEVTDVATPKTSVRYTGVWKGAYEGFLPSSKNVGTNLKMYLPNLNNFYMAGQWLFPGGGLPPAGQSGKWVIQILCKKDKKKFKVI